MSPAAEWLLDNFHIISAAARDIHHDLPPSFFRRLPQVAADEFAGLPRIYALALELIGSSAGRLDAQRLQRFISAFQSVTPLTIGELWAWPSALKLALLDHLRAQRRRARRHPRPSPGGGSAGRDASKPVHQRFHEWPAHVHHSFVTRLLQRSRALGAIASGLHQQLDAALAARGQTIEDAIRAEGQHQAAEQAGMANLIGSLRLISTFDWSEFFESVSLVEQVLQRDPAGVYGRMDFRSRDRYRHAVEELAVPTGEGQLLLALKSVERARQAHVRAPDSRECARRLPPDWRRTAAVRAQRRVAARSHTAGAAALLRVRDARLPRHDRGGHGAARRHRRPLRLVARLARRVAGLRRAAGDRAGKRAGHPAAAADDQLSDPAAPASAARARRGPAVGQDDGDRPDPLRQRGARRRAARAPRSAGARQHRPAHSLRHPQRLSGRADRDAAARCGDSRGRPRRHRGAQRQARRRRRRPVLPVPPPAPMERARRAVDGMGAQARQDRGVQPSAARRHRYELCRVRRRPERAAGDQVLHHARQRYAAAARRRARADRDHHAPAQPRRRSTRESAASPKGTASSSRASASRS